MSIGTIRGLILLANLLLLGIIGWLCYDSFVVVDQEKYFVEPPRDDRMTVPEIVEDEKQRDKAAYQSIKRVLDRPPPPPPTPPAPPPPPEAQKPDPRNIQIVALQYCKDQTKASALITAPLATSREPRFFQVGVDLGVPGFGFEPYAGCKIKEIKPDAVVFLNQKGEEVTVAGPRT